MLLIRIGVKRYDTMEAVNLGSTGIQLISRQLLQSLRFPCFKMGTRIDSPHYDEYTSLVPNVAERQERFCQRLCTQFGKDWPSDTFQESPLVKVGLTY